MNAFTRKRITKAAFGIAASGALIFSLAACSSNSGTATDTSSTSTSASAEPSAEATPLATIADLSNGVDTQVTVDASFVEALTSLGLTPGVVGTATFTDGTFSFPITGGHVDYYGPDSSVRPYVQGEIDHDGSGLSLTAGDTVVQLTDFRIDPGESKLFGTVTANGEVVAEDAYLFNLWGGTLKPLGRRRRRRARGHDGARQPRRRRAAEPDLRHRRRPGRDARRRREDHRRDGVAPRAVAPSGAARLHA